MPGRLKISDASSMPFEAVIPSYALQESPFRFNGDTEFFKNVLNVTLSTDLGPVDLLAEAPGVEGFEALWAHSQEMRLFGLPVPVASIDDLIRMKTATGRPKDTQHAMQLQALRKILQEKKPE
jgi:hypothetical protein